LSLKDAGLSLTFIPYHPGAVRYYREIGVELPAAVAAPQ
jgi:TRAP-type uncharacterized transport system substrate-binding protein